MQSFGGVLALLLVSRISDRLLDQMEAEPARINSVPDVEAQKRDANDNSAAMEEPPAKKARLEDAPNSDRQDMRDRGVAPIKAEYVCFTF
jgi:hypothetical protein